MHPVTMIGTALLSLIAAASLTLPAVVPVGPAGLPADWQAVAGGPDGGTVWVGRIPNNEVRWDHRASAIYLPPGYSTDRRYPVIHLLHGLRGSPSGFYDSLRLATIADGLIASSRARPFIAVMPVGGPIVDPDLGEWAGVWENYVVRDVVPWTDAHLSTVPSPQGRALEGLCAGGFGAVDIGLRHPGLFGTLGSWEGYFSARFRDGPFVDASPSDLAAHDPTLLVRRQASSLRRSGVRFYVSVGGNHAQILRKWTIDFAAELEGLGLQHELWQLRAPRRKDFWRATLPSALTYAAQGFASV